MISIRFRFFLTLILLFFVSIAQAKTGSLEMEDFNFIKNLFNDQRYQYVYEEGSKYLKQYPKGVFQDQVLFYLAQIDTDQKKYASAIRRYQQITKNFPKSRYTEDALYYLGILFISHQQEEKGEIVLNKLLKRNPTSSYIEKVSFALGQIGFKKKNWISAENWFLKAIKSKTVPAAQKLEARRYLAWIYHFQGKKKEAHKWFVILLNVDISTPYKAEICYQLALDQQAKGNFDKAIFWYQRQLKEFPDSRYQNISKFWVAELNFQKNKNHLAQIEKRQRDLMIQTYARDLSLKKPVNAETSLYHRALLYYHGAQLEKAERDFAQLQRQYKVHRTDKNLTLIRADIHFKLKQWPQALERIQHLFSLGSEHKKDHQILLNVAKIHEILSTTKGLQNLRKQYKSIKTQAYHQRQALAYYENAYRHLPLGDHKAVLSLIDLIIERLKAYSDHKRIIFYYKEAIQHLDIKKEKDKLKLTIANLYLKINDQDNAIKWLESLHNRDRTPLHFEASVLLGEIYLEEKRYPKAINILTAVSITSKGSPWYIDINYRLGEIYHFQEQWKKAVFYYKAVSQVPGSSEKKTEAKKSLNQILEYLQRLKK